MDTGTSFGFIFDEEPLDVPTGLLFGENAWVVEHANRTGCDMICMGTRGMTAMSGLVMGSVATRVLHLARVPVLLVK